LGENPNLLTEEINVRGQSGARTKSANNDDNDDIAEEISQKEKLVETNEKLAESEKKVAEAQYHETEEERALREADHETDEERVQREIEAISQDEIGTYDEQLAIYNEER